MQDETKNRETEEKGNLVFTPGRFLVNLLNGQALKGEGMARNIPFMIYVTGMILVYLAYGYYGESSLRKLMEADARLKEKKAAYVTNKSMLEQKKLQSKIARAIADQGLIESRTSPYLLKSNEQILTND